MSRFVKGQSGNPGGRPKEYERRLREVVDGETVDHPTLGKIPAWEAIVRQAVKDAAAGNDKARTFVADRLMGKAKQNISITSEPISDEDREKLSELTDEQLRLLAELDAPSDDDPAPTTH